MFNSQHRHNRQQPVNFSGHNGRRGRRRPTGRRRTLTHHRPRHFNTKRTTQNGRYPTRLRAYHTKRNSNTRFRNTITGRRKPRNLPMTSLHRIPNRHTSNRAIRSRRGRTTRARRRAANRNLGYSTSIIRRMMARRCPIFTHNAFNQTPRIPNRQIMRTLRLTSLVNQSRIMSRIQRRMGRRSRTSRATGGRRRHHRRGQPLLARRSQRVNRSRHRHVHPRPTTIPVGLLVPTRRLVLRQISRGATMTTLLHRHRIVTRTTVILKRANSTHDKLTTLRAFRSRHRILPFNLIPALRGTLLRINPGGPQTVPLDSTATYNNTAYGNYTDELTDSSAHTNSDSL